MAAGRIFASTESPGLPRSPKRVGASTQPFLLSHVSASQTVEDSPLFAVDNTEGSVHGMTSEVAISTVTKDRSSRGCSSCVASSGSPREDLRQRDARGTWIPVRNSEPILL